DLRYPAPRRLLQPRRQFPHRPRRKQHLRPRVVCRCFGARAHVDRPDDAGRDDPASPATPVGRSLIRRRRALSIGAMSGQAAAPPSFPDATGHFGPYGGVFVPETLVFALQQLEGEYRKAQIDPKFQSEFEYYLREFVGRPNPLYLARRLTEKLGGAKIYLK